MNMSFIGNRRQLALLILMIGLVLAFTGGLSVWFDAQLGRVDTRSDLVVPNWTTQVQSADRIEIISTDTQFIIERTATGWTMPSRGNYSVRNQTIARLDEMLAQLRYERSMTRVEEKFDRLGLGDPLHNGNGIRLTVLDANNDIITNLIIGRAQNDGSGLYVRPSKSTQAYAASGDIISLDEINTWLDLDFWSLDASAIARVEIKPEFGQSWYVQRAGIGQRRFELIRPKRWRLKTAGAANGVALAGAQLRFRDVKPEQSLSGALTAHHQGVTFSGLSYHFDFITEHDGSHWVKIRVSAQADDAIDRAQRLRNLTQGWAFKISDDAYERLTRSLNALADPTH